MAWTLNGEPAPRDPGNGWLLIDGVQFPPDWPRVDLEALGLTWVEPPAPQPDRRPTKARFADLFTYAQHERIDLLRWQGGQLTIEDRQVPGNPLVAVNIIFYKLAQPAEYLELDHPEIADGLGVMAMLGVFGDDAATEIPRILRNELPT